MSVGLCVEPFTKVWTGAMDPLDKARTYARMKAIGVVITWAAFDVDRLRLKKQKDEQMEDLVVFCQYV